MSSSTPNETAFRSAAETVPDEIPSLAPGEWEAAVAAALAAVAAAEADDPIVVELLDAQLPGGRVFTLPIPDGAAARVPTWGSRGMWLAVCQAAAECERGRAALRQHRIAAATFLRGCAAHAEFAESATGRRVAVSLGTLVERSGLSIYQLERCRRVLRMLELGVEHARGKKLNRSERAAAELLRRLMPGKTPPRKTPQRLQTGAASVWGLSTPRWALALLPSPAPAPKQTRSDRSSSRRRGRRNTRARADATSSPASSPATGVCTSASTRTPAPRIPGTGSSSITPASENGRNADRGTCTDCAPQSSGGFFSCGLSVRKDHQARTRTGENRKSGTGNRSVNVQRAAAELLRRIPALTHVFGDHQSALHAPRSHVGRLCDVLVTAGIDTDRWSGTDIAAALTHHGAALGWIWPRITDMISPLGLVAYRLALIDWSGVSPTEHATRGRRQPEEAAVTAGYRLIAARRRAVEEIGSRTPSAPASAEHRRRIRESFANRDTRSGSRTEHRTPRIMDGDGPGYRHVVEQGREHNNA